MAAPPMKKFLLPTVLVAVTALGASVLLWKSETISPSTDYLKLLPEVMSYVKENYIEPVDDKVLMQNAINGMLASLDPHSSYLPPDSFKEMKVEMSGSFGGLGIEISIRDNKLVIVAPIEDTPAYRAGIKAGDHIFKIDGKATRNMSINSAVKLMRGPRGTGVTLTILRNGTEKPLVFPLVRDIILVKSLRYKMLEPGYGYIRISQFQERTGDDFAEALHALRKQHAAGLRGLVIDLRNNPGGLLDQAVKVADRFIGEGFDNGLVVYTKGRDPASESTYSANVGAKEPAYPIVVLINGGSASASEILAGALQDHRRAVIMGTPSFGKGSVQSVIPLRNGGALKLTTAKYYTPNGRSIQAKGIEPDVIVGQIDMNGARKNDEKPFREQDLENHIMVTPSEEPGLKPGFPSKTEMAERGKDQQIVQDYQLLRALELLHGMEIMKNLRKP